MKNKKIGNILLYLLIKLFALLTRIVPFFIFKHIIGYLAILASHLLKQYNPIAKKNYEIIYGTSLSQKTAIRNVQKIYKSFGLQILEDFYMANNRYPYSALIDQISGLHYLLNAHKKGKGVIILSAHIGNFTQISIVLNSLGLNNNKTIMRSVKNPYIESYFSKLRGKLGIKWFNESKTKKSPLQILRFLKKEKGLLVLLIDQRYQKGIKVKFFGLDKKTAVGPAVLALKTSAAVIPMFSTRTNNNNNRLFIEKPVEIINTGNYENDIVLNTQHFTNILESYTAKFPKQWFALNRWWR